MINQIGENAKNAKLALSLLTSEKKDEVLNGLALALDINRVLIKEENIKDMEAGKNTGLDAALLDRLLLDDKRIDQMITGLHDLISFPDPIGEVLETIKRANGLLIEKISVPLGVVGIIYESRPNVTLDAFSLCFKSGNVSILKGGKEAIHSNIILETIIRDVLVQNHLNPDILQVIKQTDRETTKQMMKMNEYIDVLIPRGSQGLIRSVLENSNIPVIQTGAGNCHIYVDKDADQNMAIKIIINAKIQRPGVCNALESLLVNKYIASEFLPKLALALPEVTFFADSVAKSIVPGFKLAEEADYAREYLGLSASIKICDDYNDAITHINKYSTGHSEAIITENKEVAELFTRAVDSSTVYVNASTRFTDGSEFGYGAEIGISTQKLHARGPMGLKQLCSYKYIVHGNGQTRN